MIFLNDNSLFPWNLCWGIRPHVKYTFKHWKISPVSEKLNHPTTIILHVSLTGFREVMVSWGSCSALLTSKLCEPSHVLPSMNVNRQDIVYMPFLTKVIQLWDSTCHVQHRGTSFNKKSSNILRNSPINVHMGSKLSATVSNGICWGKHFANLPFQRNRHDANKKKHTHNHLSTH